MRNFRVTVNGNTYDVTVEDAGGGVSNSDYTPSTYASAPAPVPKASASKGTEGNINVKSPMPGTIVDIKVSVGDKVEANTVVAVLEAMKMENEIVTPSTGTVASVNVNKGASVNTGDVLITITE